jgi:hypothetical protein
MAENMNVSVLSISANIQFRFLHIELALRGLKYPSDIKVK